MNRDDEGRHHLVAAARGLGLDLVLEERAPAVAHGRGGFSRKGSGPGNATYYYSLPRMTTRGTLTLDERVVPVRGHSWMDHEFGTSVLEAGQRGWDWFSIQLDDGSDLMLYRLRRDDRTRDRHSAGTLVRPTGDVVPIGVDDFVLEPGARWQSAASGAEYPVAWRIAVPGAALELEVRARMAGQELVSVGSTGVAYWEGAIAVRGVRGGRPVTGLGYVGMTCYGGPPMSALLR